MDAADGTEPPITYVDLEEASVESMKTIFQLFDFQGTGHIATEDLGTVLRGLGKNLTEREVGDFINLYDKDGSGKLDFPSFYTIMARHGPMRPPPAEDEVLEHFRVFDTYANGKISCPDLVGMLLTTGEPMTREDAENLVKEIEIDGDNMIDIKEFVRYMYDTSL